MLDLFLQGLLGLITPLNLLLLVGASILGVVIGTLPGLNVSMAIAILLPMTFMMTPELGLAVLIAVYVGGMAGGMVTAVLLNMPGTSSSIATTFEGYPMAQKGQAVKALGTCVIASFIGGMIGLLLLILFAPYAAAFALKLGPAEYFSLSLMALAMVAILSQGSMVNGLIACLLGLLAGTIGFSPIDGAPRFSFGSINMMAGIAIIPFMIGLFAISQILREASSDKPMPRIDINAKGIGVTLREMKNNTVNIIRSALIGVGIGVLPGMGGTASNMIAYAAAKQSSSTPEEFGKGTPEGLWATETANSSNIGGALLPLITLGIPGDGVTAILIGAFMIHGLQPGPLLFSENPDIITTLYGALMLSVIIVITFQLATLRIFPRILMVPKHYLLPIIVVLSVLGAYASDNRLFDVWVMLGVGLFALLLGVAKLPIGPLILGFILGPIVETNLRRALMYSEGDASIFFTQPISLAFMIGLLLFVLLGLFMGQLRGLLRKKVAAPSSR